MKLFSYAQTSTPEDALANATSNQGSHYIGGGTNLIDLMKELVVQPEHLVDVTNLKSTVEKSAGGGLFIGAAVRNSDLANHQLVRTNYPVLSRALLSGPLRNCATWQRQQATLCSALAVITFMMSKVPAINASPAPDVMPSKGTTE